MGSNPYLARAQDLQDKRWAFADAYRANQLKEFETANQHIGQILSSGQIKDAETKQLRPLTDEEKASLSQSQQQVTSHIKNLYNPSFDPNTGFGGESSLHKLTDKLKITKPSAQGKTPPEQMNDLRSIQQKYQTVAPGTEELQGAQVQESIRKQKIDAAVKAIRDAGGTEDDIKQFQTKVAESAAGVPMPKTQRFYKSPDGKQADWFFPGEQPQGWQASSPTAMTQKPPKLTFRGNQAFMTDPTTGQMYSQSNIGTAPPALQAIFADGMKAAEAVRHTAGVHTVMVQQKDGTTVPVQVEVESTSGFGPASPPAGKTQAKSAKPPGQQKKDIAAIRSKGNAGVVGVGSAVGGKENTFERSLGKEAGDTNAAYQSALDRQDTMHKNQQAAYQGDQQAMLSLVANHIGMTLGAQKGARINQAVWNEAIASAPWLETIYAKWFHTDANGDHVFDGYKTGVNLTKEQIDSMVRLADEKVGTLKQHLDRSKSQLPGATQGPSDDEILDKLNKIQVPKRQP